MNHWIYIYSNLQYYWSQVHQNLYDQLGIHCTLYITSVPKYTSYINISTSLHFTSVIHHCQSSIPHSSKTSLPSITHVTLINMWIIIAVCDLQALFEIILYVLTSPELVQSSFEGMQTWCCYYLFGQTVPRIYNSKCKVVFSYFEPVFPFV